MKRSPIARKTPLRRKDGPARERGEHPRAKEPKEAKAPKERTCICGATFTPRRMEHVVCSPRCLIRKRKEDAKAERESFKARKEAIKTVKELKAEAQDEFNKYIRLRDAHLPCVSCGEKNPPMTPGGQWDAGHFLTRGGYPELAFDEDNCHKQCKSCNAGGGKFSAKARTVNEAYEEELLRRIGPERLARLRGPHSVKPLKKEELRQLKDTYRAKRRELEKGRT